MPSRSRIERSMPLAISDTVENCCAEMVASMFWRSDWLSANTVSHNTLRPTTSVPTVRRVRSERQLRICNDAFMTLPKPGSSRAGPGLRRREAGGALSPERRAGATALAGRGRAIPGLLRLTGLLSAFFGRRHAQAKIRQASTTIPQKTTSTPNPSNTLTTQAFPFAGSNIVISHILESRDDRTIGKSAWVYRQRKW